MPYRTLLTGGSGFIAMHVLENLLTSGHSVVTTVRSEDKAARIKAAYPQYKDSLSFVYVKDIAAPGAFDRAVVSNPPFDLVIHTASPFHFNTNDVQKDLINPAVNGTVNILKAIVQYAPSVRRVVITSSFAAIVDTAGKPASHSYSEKDWNPVTIEQAIQNPGDGYRASKTFAERAAWAFMEKEKPSFDLACINPPLVFGPVNPHLSTLSSLNTSNELLRDMIQGKFTEDGVPPAPVFYWVDVRDLADAHVRAAVTPAAGGKRFFITAGDYSNEEVGLAVKEAFPEYRDIVGDLSNAGYDAKGGGNHVFVESAGERPGFDNSRSREVLGVTYRSVQQSVVDTVRSLKGIPE